MFLEGSGCYEGNIMNFGIYGDVNLLEHAMKIVEKELEKRLRKLVTIYDMQFGSMSANGTNDVVFLEADTRRILS